MSITRLKDRRELIQSKVKPGSVGAEIGTYRGDFARCILETTEVGTLYCVDPWASYDAYKLDSINQEDQEANYITACDAIAPYLKTGRARIVRAYSVRAAVRQLTPQLDWFYLDANHRYEYAIEDLCQWALRLKPGGFIMGHDYVEDTEAAKRMEFGVVRAVSEFCARFGWGLEAVTSEPDWPSYCLRKQ